MSKPYDRPANGEPGGCECFDCGVIFIGAPAHTRCAVCDAAVKLVEAIEAAGRGYSIRLTRLVDDVATYTLTYRGEQHEFDSHEDASEALREWSAREKIKEARQFISELATGDPRHD